MISRREFFATGLGASGIAALILAGCSNNSSESPSSASTANGSSPTSAAPSSGTDANAGSNAAVVCFSATGNTWTIAERLASAAQAKLVRVEAAQPYTSGDLDYNDPGTRATTEQQGGTARPGIAGGAPDLSSYGTVYVGYPIWWGKAPRIILTLLEGQSLAGKTVKLFCTSGSSGIDGSLDEVRAALKGAAIADAKRFAADAPEADVSSFA